MEVFPVSCSTLSAAHIADFVKDKYAPGTSVHARILKAGISHTYLITVAEQKYIFRVYSYNWRTEKEIAGEIRLLDLLHEHHVPVSYAIADQNNVYIQHLNAPEGLRFAVMFSFAKGGKVMSIPPDLHYKAGQIMAKMHNLTQNLRLERVTYTPEILLLQSFEQLKQFLSPETAEMRYMASLQAYLLKTFNNENLHKVRDGVVHMDIWFDNMSIDNTNITIFDFDFCGNGWLLLDIAYYILQIFSTEKTESEFMLKKDSFMRGYESVTTISKEEKQLLPAAGATLYFFYLGVQCSRYDNWSNTFLNELYLERYINLLVKKWTGFHHLNESSDLNDFR